MARVHRELQCLMAAAVLFGTVGYAQDSLNQISAGDLVRAVVANEHKPQGNGKRWMYQLEKEEAGTVQTKEIIETKDGSLDKLIAVSGKSLTPQQQRQEAERIVKLARDPEQRHKLEQARKKDEEQCRNFLQMIGRAEGKDIVQLGTGSNGQLARWSFRDITNDFFLWRGEVSAGTTRQ